MVKKYSKHCRIFLEKYWKKIKRILRKISPHTKIIMVKYKYDHNAGRRVPYGKVINKNKITYPQSLELWTFCYPNLLLIPSNIWEEACINSKQSLAVWTGVRAFNIAAHPLLPELPHYTNQYWLNTLGVIQWFIDTAKPQYY